MCNIFSMIRTCEATLISLSFSFSVVWDDVYSIYHSQLHESYPHFCISIGDVIIMIVLFSLPTDSGTSFVLRKKLKNIPQCKKNTLCWNLASSTFRLEPTLKRCLTAVCIYERGEGCFGNLGRVAARSIEHPTLKKTSHRGFYSLSYKCAES